MTASAAPRAPMLSARGVCVEYGARAALVDVDLTAASGEVVALVGPNGSGKTTLLKAALGLVTPSRGEVSLLGEPIGRLRIAERARRVAWVPQEERPYDNVSIFDYVLFGRNPHLPPFGGETDHDRAVARAALVDVGLWDRRDDGIHEVSGGERQRVLLARALAQESPILLLDEPTAHLDVGHQLDLLDRVRTLCRSGGRSVLAAVHDLNLAARYADRVVALSRGRVVAEGPPSTVLTEELLAAVWGVEAEVRRDRSTGLPYVLPRLALRAGDTVRSSLAVAPGPIHVVGGGGSAAGVLHRLVAEGYRVTVGALHLLDTDTEAAEELGVTVAAEAPFAPLSDEVRRRNARLMDAARAIVVAPFWVGPSNLANLEDLRTRPGRVPVYLLGGEPMARRDFTGGAATRIVEGLRAEGAIDVADLPALLVELRRRWTAIGAGAPAGGPAGTPEGPDAQSRGLGPRELGEQPR